MNKTEAIKQFLSEQPNASEIAQRYNSDLEVQVNVSTDGKPVTQEASGKRFQAYTDGEETWKPFRIPWNARAEPSYEDSPLKYSTDRFAAIGMTGWNWAEERSEWVGYDFDSIINHAKGLSNEELKRIYNLLEELPFTTIYTSTSGSGYHVYVDITNSPKIRNHTDHAAFSRAILSKISGLCGFEITSKVDVCGGILWVWKIGAKGFKLLKKGNSLDGQTIIDWTDHRDATRLRGQRKVSFESAWDTLQQSVRRQELDPDHLKLLRWLNENNCCHWWDADHWMLVCHTYDLKEAHNELNLIGIYDTVSTGKDKGTDQNCFCFPMGGGSWVVRRHTIGTTEHKTWSTDRSGWTYCFFNRLPVLSVACTLHGHEDKSETYNFKSMSDVVKTLSLYGIDCTVPEFVERRSGAIKDIGHSKVLVTFKAIEGDPDIDEWFRDKKVWKKVFQLPHQTQEEFNVDHLVRHLVANGKDAGWYVNTGNWVFEPKSNVVDVLVSKGIKRGQVSAILGKGVSEHWKLVNLPFQDEYPGNRQWNLDAAQLINAQPGDHPHWDKILEHCGQSFRCESNEWCLENGILRGQDYLSLWLASIIQYPLEPLPYLFFYGPQNSGKSIFHEAFNLLLRGKGLCRADIAITSSGHFNAEIEGAVLCVVEEINLQQNKQAYEKIKDWVTSKTISIHRKGQTPYDIANSTHWVHCANDASFCPIFHGDTRIAVCYVPPIDEPIPKFRLLNSLQEEAPAFLDTLLNTEIPDATDRLRIPLIMTDEKIMQADANKTFLEQFLENEVHYATGHRILFADFCDRFRTWLPAGERGNWSNTKIGRSMSPEWVRGRMGEKNDLYMANVAFEAGLEPKSKLNYVNGRLK
jgi:hypothetical protein